MLRPQAPIELAEFIQINWKIYNHKWLYENRIPNKSRIS